MIAFGKRASQKNAVFETEGAVGAFYSVEIEILEGVMAEDVAFGSFLEKLV